MNTLTQQQFFQLKSFQYWQLSTSNIDWNSTFPSISQYRTVMLKILIIIIISNQAITTNTIRFCLVISVVMCFGVIHSLKKPPKMSTISWWVTHRAMCTRPILSWIGLTILRIITDLRFSRLIRIDVLNVPSKFHPPHILNLNIPLPHLQTGTHWKRCVENPWPPTLW